MKLPEEQKSMSSQIKDLIELAVEIWRMEQRLNKVMSSIPENQKELFDNSIQKFKKYLNKNNIEIVDHTNQTFNEGRNVEIISIEKDNTISESIIKQTMEPTIIYKDQVVHKGKVIVLEKNNEGLTEEKNE